MTRDEQKYIWECIAKEGFDYCFGTYLSPHDLKLKDQHLKDLMLNFLWTRKALYKYVKADEAKLLR